MVSSVLLLSHFLYTRFRVIDVAYTCFLCCTEIISAVACGKLGKHVYNTCKALTEEIACFRYAAVMMPFNVAPAICCMIVAANQETSVLALAWVWAGLGLVMVRFAASCLQFVLVLPTVSHLILLA
jgi:hypothetical protein